MKIKTAKTIANIHMVSGVFTLLVADNMLVEALGCLVAGMGLALMSIFKTVDALNIALAEEGKETIELTKLNFTINK